MWQEHEVAHSFDLKPRTNDVLTTEAVTFEELLLSERILSGLKKAGFYRPSPIQLKAIPLGRCGLDLVVQAKSGTGKTCVFSVVALESINSSSPSLQVVVLAPTREIALQIQGVIACIGQDISGLNAQAFIGGTLVAEDRIKAKKCHIAIGSPGRIKQLIELGILVTNNVRMFVLDEADKLVEEGSFQQQINWIYSALPENKQVIALSATYPKALAEFLTRYMREATYARLDSSNEALLGLRQYYVEVKNCSLPYLLFEEKMEQIVCLLSGSAYQQAMIFSNFHSKAESACEALKSYGWPATYVSGYMTQSRRIEAINKLKLYECRILLSTDLTSRGIDARNVDLVINLDLPSDWETYMHRIGRAGRFGSRGTAISLVSSDEKTRLQSWISLYHAPILPICEMSKLETNLQLKEDATSPDKVGTFTKELCDIQPTKNQENPIVDKTTNDNTQRHIDVIHVNGNVDTSTDESSSIFESDSEDAADLSSSPPTATVRSCADSNLDDFFPYDTVAQEKNALPLIPSLMELKERSWHTRTNTHYLGMNYAELKADYEYFKRTHEFASPPTEPTDSSLTRLGSMVDELTINEVAEEKKVNEALHLTEEPHIDSTALVKSNAAQPSVGSRAAVFTSPTDMMIPNKEKANKTSSSLSTDVASEQKGNSSVQPQLSQRAKLVRKRHPLSAAAGIDILKHWTSVDKLSVSKSQSYFPNNENTKRNVTTVVSRSDSSTATPSGSYVIPARRKMSPTECDSSQNGNVNVSFQSHTAEEKFCEKLASDTSSCDESSSYSDESYSDESSDETYSDESNDEYTDEDSASVSSTDTTSVPDVGRKYGPGVGRWRSVNSHHDPHLQNSHPILCPPFLFPFSPTGHCFTPAMYPYTNAKSAQEAHVSHQVYQFALQHARQQVSNL